MSDSDEQGILATRNWRLRWAVTNDLDSLHAVACQPEVYRYRFDGEAPAKELIFGMIEQSMAVDDRVGVGLGVLEAPAGPTVTICRTQLSP